MFVVGAVVVCGIVVAVIAVIVSGGDDIGEVSKERHEE